MPAEAADLWKHLCVARRTLNVILDPASYPCHQDREDLTELVLRELPDVPVAYARLAPGLLPAFGKKRPFRVIVTCPRGGGHEEACEGTYEVERS